MRPSLDPPDSVRRLAHGLHGRLAPLARAFVDFQLARPWTAIAIVALLSVPAVLAARSLGLRTEFAELLPENKPSVVEMRRVSARLTSASTLTIVARGRDAGALRRFADALVPRIRALGPDEVGAVDFGRQERGSFLEKNRLLYAPLDEIRKVRDEIRERYDYEVQKRAGNDLGLGDPPPPISAQTVRSRFEKHADAAKKEAGGAEPEADGYYLGRTDAGDLLVAILVRTPVEPGDVARAPRLRGRIEAVVRETDPARFDPAMTVAYTGDFITSVEEFQKVKDDLGHVGLLGVSSILAVVFLYFLRVRTLVAMAATIGVGLAWTFGATRLLVGHLNSSTGFLVSIIAGNGINFGIIYMARYLEARRTTDADATECLRVAHRDTWLATLAVAGAAMAAYVSLAITDFRGFKHFGVIAGSGMILCWIATYALLPAVLRVAEDVRAADYREGGLRLRLQGLYGWVFALLAERAPRAVTLAAVAAGVAAGGVAACYFARDPMEYDLEKLVNADREGRESPARVLSWNVDRVVGRMGQDGMAIMTERADQVAPLARELERRRASAAPDAKPFQKVVTIHDLLPSDQADKVALLGEVRDLVTRARGRGWIGDVDWKDLEPWVPPPDLRAIGVADLPEPLARAFTEVDGTRGRIVYIVPAEGRSVWDARYLKLWADSYREVPLPEGGTVRGSGRAVIFADMIDAIGEDAPRAIAASLAGTFLVIVLAFRLSRAAFGVLATVALGVVWMVAFLALRGMKINFLNFVAVPITIGIGADYAINVMGRHRIEGDQGLRRTVVETGGAVVLCSLTTILGYLSLTFSMNRAIVSFGVAAAAGEIACIVAAVLVLPAALHWSARRRIAAHAVRARVAASRPR